jgi:hypothetical protein
MGRKRDAEVQKSKNKGGKAKRRQQDPLDIQKAIDKKQSKLFLILTFFCQGLFQIQGNQKISFFWSALDSGQSKIIPKLILNRTTFTNHIKF